MSDAQKKDRMPARRTDGLFERAGAAMNAVGAQTVAGTVADRRGINVVAAAWPRFSPWAAAGIQAPQSIVLAGNTALLSRPRAS